MFEFEQWNSGICIQFQWQTLSNASDNDNEVLQNGCITDHSVKDIYCYYFNGYSIQASWDKT